jgi:hypothetical protein
LTQPEQSYGLTLVLLTLFDGRITLCQLESCHGGYCGTNVRFALWQLSVIRVVFPQKVKPAMASVADLITEAIQKKLIVRAIYQDYERIMCPHVIGYKKGVLNALFFQFGGGSKSGLPVGGMWRCIHIGELSR